MTTDKAVADARTAVERGEWQAALDLLGTAEEHSTAEHSTAEHSTAEHSTSGEALELRAAAAYGSGDFEGAVSAWEQLHSRSLGAGDRDEAARAAAMIAMYLMMDTGLMAPVRGWLHRAETLLDGSEERPAQALIAMTRTYERFMSGDMEAAREQSELAVDLGERLGVQPAAVIGRVANARIRILDGDVTEGLAQLDEVGALLMSGTVDPLTTGMMYCELICAAQGLALHGRAREWTEVMERWRPGAAIGGINGRCRVHRAEMLRMSGPCDLAEEEALGACDDLRPWMRREFGWPLAELGNIRLRKGDIDGAEEAYLAAHQHAWTPHPGLALVRLAQGDVASASSLIADAIAHPVKAPSKERPPLSDLSLAPLFDAQVEIAAAAGDVEIARSGTARLEEIACRYQSPALAASAALARARTALLEGRIDQAKDDCIAAITDWAAIGAPYEASLARMVLAETHKESANLEAAVLEWTTAQKGFEAFGARRWAAVAAELASGNAGPSHRSAPPETGMFVRDGDMRVVQFDGITVHVRDLKGFRYCERLLADRGREFHVLDLVAVEQGTLPAATTNDVAAGRSRRAESEGLPVLDDEARLAYQRRLLEVEEDIEEATRANDLARIELAERDRDYLIAELSRAVGLGGRLRSVGSDAERARTSVARSLRYAFERLAEHHPALAAHLKDSIRTGTYCSYSPDPMAHINWQS